MVAKIESAWLLPLFMATAVMLGISIAISPKVGVVVVACIVLFLLTLHVKSLIAAVGFTIPFSASLGVSAGPLFVAVCDVLAIVLIIYWVMQYSLFRRKGAPYVPKLRGATIPIIGILSLYFIVAIFNAVVYDHTWATHIDIMQRIQLTILWAIVGSVIYFLGQFETFAKSFTAAALILSLLWIASPGAGGVLGVQKNPSGGFIVSAFLVVLLSNYKMSVRLPVLLLLAAGLVSTGSRGSMLGLAFGIVILSLYLNQWKKIALPLAMALMATVLVFFALPSHVSSRILARNDSGIYNIEIREIFIQDAMEKFRANPFSGVGVGNYVQTHPMLQRVETLDPHNVYALTLAEGGYPLFAAFMLMLAGPLYFIVRMNNHYTPLAVAVQIAIIAHAFVDVYWVRGTPAFGWLLIGVVFAHGYIRQLVSRKDDVSSQLKHNTLANPALTASFRHRTHQT